ncbi:MAG: hypothetical protein AAF197_07430 [Pseudomonadota bacterium]
MNIKTISLLLTFSFLAACGSDNRSSDSKQWCDDRGGRYDDGSCTLPISEADCKAQGGRLEDPFSCVMPMSKDDCDKLGGTLNSVKQCVIRD